MIKYRKIKEETIINKLEKLDCCPMGACLMGRNIIGKKRICRFNATYPSLTYFSISYYCKPFKNIPLDLIQRVLGLWDKNKEQSRIAAIQLCYSTPIGKYIDAYLNRKIKNKLKSPTL